MRPESVEIKVTVAGDYVEGAISTLALTGGAGWSILFCEDVTAGAAGTPLLDLGVILRARRKSDSKGDSTVKLRPCRWSQLDGQYFVNADDGVTELKVEPDWAGSGRQLAASMTAKWSDGRMSKVQAGDEPPASLFSDRQREFLALCSGGRINLSALTALTAFTATRWKEFPPPQTGSTSASALSAGRSRVAKTSWSCRSSRPSSRPRPTRPHCGASSLPRR